MNNKRKILKGIAIVNILIYFGYLILKLILSSEIYFRKSVMDFLLINKFIFIVVVAMLVIGAISEITERKLLKAVLYIVGIIITIVLIMINVFVYVFDVKEESLAYRDGKLIVAVLEDSFLNSTIGFYEPINSILMKKTNIENITYDGGCNRYEHIEKDFLQIPEVDIYNYTNEIYFFELNPWSAKEKFSDTVFNYLGNKTYDFGDITIKFNEDETYVEEAIIKRPIVKYKDQNLIGENINDIEKYMKEQNVYFIYDGSISEENNQKIKLAKYNDDSNIQSDFSLIVDENGVISAVKYFEEKDIE